MPDSLEEFLERVAANTPTPGGGTVSAICGAMSAALSRMVVNLAVGKQGYEGAQSDLAAMEARGTVLQRRFLDLAAEDAKAGCPISRLLKTEITMSAHLSGERATSA